MVHLRADGFKKSSLVMLRMAIPSRSHQHGFAMFVQPRASGSSDALPDAVRGQWCKVATIEILKVVENDLPNRKVDPHFQGARGDQNVNLACSKCILCLATLVMAQAGVVMTRPGAFGDEIPTQFLRSAAALNEDQRLPAPLNISFDLTLKQVGLFRRFTVVDRPPLKGDGTPARLIGDAFKPVRDFRGVANRGRQADEAGERVEASES